MVVVVDVPDGDGCRAFVFAVVFAGVEDLFGEDALVALSRVRLCGRAVRSVLKESLRWVDPL